MTTTEIEEKTVTFEPGDPARFGRLLGDAMLFASTDTLRPVLNGACVAVLNGGTIEIVATDSRILGHFRDDEGDKKVTPVSWNGGEHRPEPAPPGRRVVGTCGPYIYERTGLVEIGKRLAKIKPGTETVSIAIEPTGLCATGVGWTLIACRVPGEFPNWPQLIPDLNADPKAEPAPYFNTELLGTIGKLTLGRATRKGETLALRMQTFGPLKPAALIADAPGVEFVGLIMPTKNGNT